VSAASFTANLAAYLLQTTLLLAAGLPLPRLFGMRDPHIRLRYWYALLSFSLLVPFVWLAGRPPAASSGSFTGRLAGGMEVQVHAGLASLSPWVWVPVALAAGAAARALWLLGGLVLLERLRRRSRVLDPVPQAFHEASDVLLVDAEFRTSPSVSTPLTFGWARPVVLLSEAVTEMSPEAQRCIALHELLHVRRRDWLAILLEESLRSVLWFHPALWLVLDRVALSREQSVDMEVVRITEARRTYMSTLSAMARTRHGAAAVAILPFFHRSHLLQRLALLTKEVSMSKFRLGLTVAGSLAVLLFAGVIAMKAFPLMGQPGSIPTGRTAARGSAASGQSVEPSIYELGTKGLLEPKLLNKDEVKFARPPGAPPKTIETLVVLGLVIDEQGVPTEIKVLKSGNEVLSTATIDAVSRWRWEPAMMNGKPVSIRWTVTVLWGDKEATQQGDGSTGGLAAPVAANPEGGIYPMGSIEAPKLITQVNPVYPEEARQKGLKGRVVLEIVINPKGETTQVKIVKSDNEIFNASAKEAVAQWRYESPMHDGKPVSVRWIITINYVPTK